MEENKTKETAEKAPQKKPAPRQKAAQNKPTFLEDHVRIRVRSNQYGRLVFVNSRTRERTFWENINDEQDMTVADLRDMKANARRFFEEPWVSIGEILTPGYESLTHKDVLELLGVTRYYEQSTRPEYLSSAIDWDLDTILNEVPKMKLGTRENLVVAVGEAIRAGKLNALDRIRAWEKVLKCTLLDAEG